jgi:hypothetical protein
MYIRRFGAECLKPDFFFRLELQAGNCVRGAPLGKGSSSRVSSLINPAAVTFNQAIEKFIFSSIKINVKSDLPEAKLTYQ